MWSFIKSTAFGIGLGVTSTALTIVAVGAAPVVIGAGIGAAIAPLVVPYLQPDPEPDAEAENCLLVH
jgi:hypothetical protein